MFIFFAASGVSLVAAAAPSTTANHCEKGTVANDAQCWDEAWRKAFLETFQNYGADLIQVDTSSIQGIPEQCKKSETKDKALFYLTLAENICGHESSNKPETTAKTPAATGQFAKGLCQLSKDSMQQEAYKKYGCEINNEHQGENTEGSTYNPVESAKCMAAVMIALVSKDKVLAEGNKDDTGKGVARYFQPMQEQDAQKKADILKKTGEACGNQFQAMKFSSEMQDLAGQAGTGSGHAPVGGRSGPRRDSK